jgi:amino acid transporter
MPQATLQPHEQRSKSALDTSYGLRKGVLSPLETLAQSIAGIAPSGTPAMLVPLVFAFARSGTCWAYVVATIGVILVGYSISQFAKRSSSPGSLYTFVQDACGRRLGLLVGWAMVFAYTVCLGACAVQFALYAQSVLRHLVSVEIAPALLVIAGLVGSGLIAYRNIKLSAALMLRLEVLSMALILTLVGAVLYQHQFRIDMTQIFPAGATFEQIRQGLVLAIFGFAAFETAASLGVEARDPLRTIPQALMQSIIVSGMFFVITSYCLVLSFHGASQPLEQCSTPLLGMANRANVPFLGQLIDVGVMVSFFAAAIANLNAGARTLFFMGHHGTFHSAVMKVHQDNCTPHVSILGITICGAAPAIALVLFRFPLMDIIGWLGTLATYGFMAAYMAVSAAAIVFLAKRQELTIWGLIINLAAVAVMCMAFAGSVWPIPPAPYSLLPILFAIYMLGGGVWLFAKNSSPLTAESE